MDVGPSRSLPPLVLNQESFNDEINEACKSHRWSIQYAPVASFGHFLCVYRSR